MANWCAISSYWFIISYMVIKLSENKEDKGALEKVKSSPLVVHEKKKLTHNNLYLELGAGKGDFIYKLINSILIIIILRWKDNQI